MMVLAGKAGVREEVSFIICESTGTDMKIHIISFYIGIFNHTESHFSQP
jgi:hypothetical protein